MNEILTKKAWKEIIYCFKYKVLYLAPIEYYFTSEEIKRIKNVLNPLED